MDQEPVIESSGNVFVDLGFSPAEANSLALRAERKTHRRDSIAARGLHWLEP